MLQVPLKQSEKVHQWIKITNTHHRMIFTYEKKYQNLFCEKYKVWEGTIYSEAQFSLGNIYIWEIFSMKSKKKVSPRFQGPMVPLSLLGPANYHTHVLSYFCPRSYPYWYASLYVGIRWVQGSSLFPKTPSRVSTFLIYVYIEWIMKSMALYTSLCTPWIYCLHTKLEKKTLRKNL